MANNFKIRAIKENHIFLEEEEERKSVGLFWLKHSRLIQAILSFLAMFFFSLGVGITVYNAYNNSFITKNIKGEAILEGTSDFSFGSNFFPVKEDDALALFYPDYFTSYEDLDYNGVYSPKDIKVTNTGAEVIFYSIVVEELSVTNSDRLNPNLLKYRCTNVTNNNVKNSTEYKSDFLTSNKFKGKIYDNANPDGYTPENHYVLYSGKLEPGYSVNYSIIAWIDYDAKIDLSMHYNFNGRIKVIFEYENEK